MMVTVDDVTTVWLSQVTVDDVDQDMNVWLECLQEPV